MCERHSAEEMRQRLSPAASVILGAITFYRLSFSMILGRQCRFLPTCSEYAAEAIRKHGAWRGMCLALARISRCHPWGESAFDPVPDVTAGKWWQIGAIVRSRRSKMEVHT